MTKPVALATHEWPPARTDAAEARGTAVLVHGVTGWHRTWWRVGPALAERGWRVVAVDLRGHGRSPRIDGTVKVAGWATDVAAVIERLGTPVALVGHSLGGAVSAEIVVSRPELVRRAVLEDPPAISRADDVEWLTNLKEELAAARTRFDAEVTRTLAENPAWRHEDARQDVEGKTLADEAGIVASVEADIRTRVLDLAPRLAVPCLFLLGAEGRSVFPAEARRRLASTLPAGSEVRVVDAGHTIHRDRFDDYVRAVADWIER